MTHWRNFCPYLPKYARLTIRKQRSFILKRTKTAFSNAMPRQDAPIPWNRKAIPLKWLWRKKKTVLQAYGPWPVISSTPRAIPYTTLGAISKNTFPKPWKTAIPCGSPSWVSAINTVFPKMPILFLTCVFCLIRFSSPSCANTQEVADYIFKDEPAQNFRRQLLEFLQTILPYYDNEGRYRLCIAIGCTGGCHRSVAMVEYLAKNLMQSGYRIIKEHKQLTKK